MVQLQPNFVSFDLIYST